MRRWLLDIVRYCPGRLLFAVVIIYQLRERKVEKKNEGRRIDERRMLQGSWLWVLPSAFISQLT